MLREQHGTYSWEGQRWQYDQLGPPGEIVYHRFSIESTPIDTLLHYDERGTLDGILNTYPQGHFDGIWTEQSGNVNTFERPGLGGKVADQLMAEAARRWPGTRENIAEWKLRGNTPLLSRRLPANGGHRITRMEP